MVCGVGGGGQGREGVQLPDSLMNEAVLQSVGPAWRLRSLLPDGSRLKKCPPKRVTVPPTFHPLPSLLNVIDFEAKVKPIKQRT